MTSTQHPETYLGKTAVDRDGTKIGTVGQVYLNDQTGQPDWITVNTGLFGMKENFAPLYGSSFDGDELVLPFGKDVVKDAPDVSDSSHLDVDEQQALNSYYQGYLGGGTGYEGNGGTGYEGSAGAVDERSETRDVSETAGTAGTTGTTGDEAMTRSEEHLNVGTEQVEAGRARLRKFVVTEQQTVTVPVSHEEVRVEREPITETNRGEALSGPEITEAEHEVVLTAERPVVTTEAVPVERFRLGKETVTEQETVSREVRKEQVEVHDETADGDVDVAGRPENR